MTTEAGTKIHTLGRNASSSDPMLEAPWCRFRREARARERHRHCSGDPKRPIREELIQFRKMLKGERRKGIPVVALARKHGISPAYIYLLP